MSGQANLGPAFRLEADHERNRNQRIDSALQVGIVLLSIAAMYLISITGVYSRWGFVIGLASQPLWFACTWRARQYGLFILAIFYTGAWIQGVANRFF